MRRGARRRAIGVCVLALAAACEPIGGLATDGPASDDGGTDAAVTPDTTLLDAPAGDGSSSGSCVSDEHTFCEDFDTSTSIPAGWIPKFQGGTIVVESAAGAPSTPNVLHATTKAGVTGDSFAVIVRDHGVRPASEATLEMDTLFSAAGGYQNLATVDMVLGNASLALQLTRQDGETFVEQYLKNNISETSVLSPRSTGWSGDRWVHLTIGFTKNPPAYFVTVDGTRIISDALRSDASDVIAGGALRTSLGISYETDGSSASMLIDNVRITWK